MNNKEKEDVLVAAGSELGEHFLEIVSARKSITATDINAVVRHALANALVNGVSAYDEANDYRIYDRTAKTARGKWTPKK